MIHAPQKMTKSHHPPLTPISYAAALTGCATTNTNEETTSIISAKTMVRGAPRAVPISPDGSRDGDHEADDPPLAVTMNPCRMKLVDMILFVMCFVVCHRLQELLLIPENVIWLHMAALVLLVGLFVWFFSSDNMDAPVQKIVQVLGIGCIHYFLRLHPKISDSDVMLMWLAMLVALSALNQNVNRIGQHQRRQEMEDRRLRKEMEDCRQMQEMEDRWPRLETEDRLRTEILEDRRLRRERPLMETRITVRTSVCKHRRSTSKDHDHEKRQYRTQEDANDVIVRMRRQGFDAYGTLKSYYNPEYDRWFVGNGFEINHVGDRRLCDECCREEIGR